MMKFTKIHSGAVLAVLFLIVFTSCKKDHDNDDTAYTATPYFIHVPSNLPAMEIPAYNPTTVEGVYLGRMLYYDSLMHPTKSFACASCHLQEHGFATPGTNVIPHVNLGFSSKYLWDGHLQGSLEDAMKYEVETFFGTNLNDLRSDPEYPELFRRAFGTPEINYQRVEYALAQWLRTIVSGNSKFDRFMRHEENLTPQEMLGFQIFNTEQGDCFHCHSLSLMTDGQLHNNGLDSVFTSANAGYYNYSGNPADLGKFKSPSLRNVGLRTTYMHDGRYTSLEQVINFYNNEVKLSPSLDPIMTKPGKEFGLELAPHEVQAVKAFLLTLTDTTITTDPKFSNPHYQ